MDKPPRLAKVLPFVRRTRPGDTSRTAGRTAAHSPAAWHRSRWFWFSWWAMAWMIAASRLQVATLTREVFGLEATLAFMVAVVLPLMASPALFDLARDTYRGVRDLRQARTSRAIEQRRSRRNAG
jgi:hypothetical protein